MQHMTSYVGHVNHQPDRRGHSAVRLNGASATDILLADDANHCLTVLRANKTGAYEVADKFQTGAVNLQRMHVADLDGSGKPTIVLAGQDDFHILRPGLPRVALRFSIASYESPVRNGRLENVEVGDLRGDGRPQIIVTEGTKQLMELLTWRKEAALHSSAATAGVEEPRIERALAWPVFEAKAFPGGRMGPAPMRPARETGQQGVPRLLVEVQRHAGRLRHDLAREIVRGRPQPAGDDHQAGIGDRPGRARRGTAPMSSGTCTPRRTANPREVSSLAM